MLPNVSFIIGEQSAWLPHFGPWLDYVYWVGFAAIPSNYTKGSVEMGDELHDWVYREDATQNLTRCYLTVGSYLSGVLIVGMVVLLGKWLITKNNTDNFPPLL